MDPNIPLMLALVVVLAGQLLRTTLVTGAALLLARSPAGRRHRVFALPPDTGQLRSELWAGARVIAFDTLVVLALRWSGALRSAPQWTWWDALLLAVAAFAWYEVWFYAIHRALHSPLLFRFHRQHHRARVTNPFTALSFGLVERGLLVAGLLLPLACWSQVAPIALPGLMLYGFANYLANVFGHANVDLTPAWFARVPLLRSLVTPTFHSLHHARHRGHYGLFTTWLDEWAGTAFADRHAVQERVRAGHALERLGERAA